MRFLGANHAVCVQFPIRGGANLGGIGCGSMGCPWSPHTSSNIGQQRNRKVFMILRAATAQASESADHHAGFVDPAPASRASPVGSVSQDGTRSLHRRVCVGPGLTQRGG